MKKNIKKCSLFEEMLMWTSYRYCIGRHTYVVSMAHDIAANYFNKLSDERKEFTVNDIRREIKEKLSYMPFNFHTQYIYGNDGIDCLDKLFTFIERENINSIEELVKYNDIIYMYDHNTKEYKFESSKIEPNINSYFSVSDIEDLIPWMNLANCFDVNNHKNIVTKEGEIIRCFKSWSRKLIPVDNKEGYVRFASFGWEPVWISLDRYLKSEYCGLINNDVIKEIKDVD